MRHCLRFDECRLRLTDLISRSLPLIDIAHDGHDRRNFAKLGKAERDLNPKQDSILGFAVPFERLLAFQACLLKLLDRALLRVGVKAA